MLTNNIKRKSERINLRIHYDKFRSKILPQVNLVKYYVNNPSSFVCCSLLWFNIDNRYFNVRTGRGANHGTGRNEYFNIHYTIDVLGFDLSFKYKYYCK